MSSAIHPNSDAEILARVIAPDAATIPVAVAAELLKWGFSDFDKRRMSELAAKARAEELTAEEKNELDGYERINSFLGLVKSKARSSLRGNSAR
jgi:hypothetical protein